MKPEKTGRKKRRRTETIVLGMAMSALILTACDDEPDTRRCVDRATGQVVEGYLCQDDETTKHNRGSTTGGGVFVWYFGGSGYSRGERVSGGSLLPPPGYTSRGGFFSRSGSGWGSSGHSSSWGVSRGGFGGSAAAHASSGS